MDTHCETSLVERALKMALAQRKLKPGDLLHHSDRGGQYASDAYQTLLHTYGVTVSMSRTADPYDNALMESAIGTIKTECADRVFVSRAAARSYRLSQTHAHCKVVYLFAEGTMEQTVVQLMSRKQRAAKLLTEGEGGFEQALLDAIGRDETVFDPTALFKAAAKTGEIDAEDAAYWNVESMPEDAPEIIELPAPVVEIAAEPLPTVTRIATPSHDDAICAYLETVHMVFDARKWESLRKNCSNG